MDACRRNNFHLVACTVAMRIADESLSFLSVLQNELLKLFDP